MAKSGPEEIRKVDCRVGRTPLNSGEQNAKGEARKATLLVM
jgi:hypothetical protein